MVLEYCPKLKSVATHVARLCCKFQAEAVEEISTSCMPPAMGATNFHFLTFLVSSACHLGQTLVSLQVLHAGSIRVADHAPSSVGQLLLLFLNTSDIS